MSKTNKPKIIKTKDMNNMAGHITFEKTRGSVSLIVYFWGRIVSPRDIPISSVGGVVLLLMRARKRSCNKP